MDSSSAEMEGRPKVARYACESCKKRKTKCTREIPKCAACKPWPGPCNYARQFPDPVAAPVAAPSSATLEPANIFVSSSLPDRLDRIEATLQTLTAAVTKLLAVTEAKSSQEPKPESNPAAKQPDETDRSTRSKATCTITPPAISSLDEANAHLGNIIPSHDDHDDHNDHNLALQNLTDLSNTLTSFRLDMSLDLGPHDNRQYIVPSLETGNLIISKFTPLTLFASPFFTPPSPRLLSTIIFSPGTVAPGWIIYTNYFLLSSPITATLFPSSVPHWRHNVRLALQNASLYLHPSKVNIAAFTMLSFHGEDFAASPNVSWMLCSHLCRMAQALRLWEGGGAEEGEGEGEGEEEKQRGLALFWAIYNMEKCCALTFGRSQVGLWEGVDVERVEMPRGEWFGAFRPHLTDQRRAKGVEGVDAEFGGYIFLRNVELAKLSGRVLEYLGKGEGTEEEREVLKGRLAEWFRETDETFRRGVERERQGGVPGAGVDVKREKVMRLYEFTVKFRYLHVLIILTKDSPGDRGLRVESARQAIGILPMTISGWDPVYNGVIWHLLYYPFTPFFVVFGHIVTNPRAETVPSDLRLLETVVEYIIALQPLLTLLRDLTAKLQKTAEIFLRLARRHVAETTGSIPFSSALQEDVTHPTGFSQPQDQPDLSQHPPEMVMPDQQDLFSLEGVDIDRFLSWVPQPMGFPGDIDFGVGDGTAGEEEEEEEEQQQQQQQNRGVKRPLEATFDWFSWENYYADATQ